MKKRIALFNAAVLLACLLLAAPAAVFAEQESALIPAYPEQSIDLDLSRFSGVVVYAQIYQMAIHPEDYLGMIVRLSGWYDVIKDSDTGIVYTLCLIPDAAACCTQGVEFVWAGRHSFPDDYPSPGAEITVTGRFETYFEGEWEYMHLTDAIVRWE